MRKPREALNIRCHCCPVSDRCLAKDQDEPALAWLDSHIEHYQVFEPGEHLFRKGGPVEYVFAVRVGTGKLYQIDHSGSELIYDFFNTGDIVGLRYAHHQQYASGALVMEKTFACLIPVNIIREPPSFIYTRLLNLMCHKLIRQQPYQCMTSAKKRVAAFFLDIITKAQANGAANDAIVLKPTHSDISRKLGIANETFSRILSEFAANGDLLVKNHVIEQYNLHALDQRVGCDLHLDTSKTSSL